MYNMGLVDSFIKLNKPAVWLSYPFDKEEISRLINKFPSVIIHREYDKTVTDFWFFQNKNIKKKFKHFKLDKDIEIGERNHEKLGEILGFPPKAIENFTKVADNLRLQKTKIGVDYAGINFMSYEDSIIDDLLWLKERYKVNKTDITVRFYYEEVTKDLKSQIDDIIAS